MSQQAASPAPKPRYVYHLMITHPTEPRILMLPGESGWALPHFESEERFHDVGVPMINRETKNQLGLDTIVLRSAHVVVDHGARKRVEYVFVLENHSPGWTPPTGALWVGSAELAGLKLARPDHRYEPPERLIEAFDLGYKLGMLHQIISYQHILASLEPASRSDLEGGPRYWARRLLQSITAT